MDEEYEILENTVKDFSAKFLDNDSMKIENENISEDLLQVLASQGFLSLTSQPSEQGQDLLAYSVVLEGLAKSCPSVAVKTLLMNSFLSLVKDKSIVDLVSTGRKSGTVTYSDLLAGKAKRETLSMEGGKLRGTKEFVFGSDSDFIITLTDTGELVLVKSGFKAEASYNKLGFRSIGFSRLTIDSDDFEVLEKNGSSMLTNSYRGINIPVAAIALGMSEMASEKAIEYSKVRMAFGHYLKDFQPLTFEMASLVAELNIQKKYFQSILLSPQDIRSSLSLKVKTLRLAKDIAKTSLQIHGGYGYLEDFGIEKFYRDSMALSILFGNEEKDMETLSSLIYGEKAGFV